MNIRSCRHHCAPHHSIDRLYLRMRSDHHLQILSILTHRFETVVHHFKAFAFYTGYYLCFVMSNFAIWWTFPRVELVRLEMGLLTWLCEMREVTRFLNRWFNYCLIDQLDLANMKFPFRFRLDWNLMVNVEEFVNLTLSLNMKYSSIVRGF